MGDCLFCKIISGEIPSTKVYEDDLVYAFRDINPAASVHVLIAPKAHIASIADVTEADTPALLRTMQVANRIAAADGIAESGYRILTNTGPDAGQTIFHLHWHVLGGNPLGALVGRSRAH